MDAVLNYLIDQVVSVEGHRRTHSDGVCVYAKQIDRILENSSKHRERDAKLRQVVLGIAHELYPELHNSSSSYDLLDAITKIRENGKTLSDMALAALDSNDIHFRVDGHNLFIIDRKDGGYEYMITYKPLTDIYY